jgi:hypothetical protein
MTPSESDEKKDKEKERKRLWYQRNKERRQAACKKYYNSRKEYFAEKHAKFHTENRDRLIDYAIRRAKENPASASAASQKLRAKRIKRVPPWYGELDYFVMAEATSLCHDRKVATGIEWHVDHMFPLNGKLVSGLHCWNNVQCIPGFLNVFKKNRQMMTEPFEWLGYL